MSEGVRSFLLMLKAVGIIVALGALVSYIFYSIKRKDLFGGYIGGLVIGVVGALIGDLVLHDLFYDIAVKVLDFLSRGAGVDVIAGFIGAYVALTIMNRLNHNKERKKY